MSETLCPDCHGPIPVHDINIAEGVALCRSCGRLHRLSELIDAAGPDTSMLDNPPPGCRIYEEGYGTTVHASARSPGTAVGLLFACAFWNGILSIFMLIAWGSLYRHLAGPLPAWFPTPFSGGSGHPIGLGVTIFMLIFLVPFELIGAGILVGLLVSLFGHVEVRLRGISGTVHTGVGLIGWRRRFDAGSVRKVALGESAYTEDGKHKEVITIEADRKIRFATLLSDERRRWMVAALHTLLVAPPARSRRAR